MHKGAEEYCFYEKIEAHKAILIRLKPAHQYYEVLTIFREYCYETNTDRKPIFYLSDTQYFSRNKIPLNELEYNDFLAVLNMMDFKISSEDRFEIIAAMMK